MASCKNIFLVASITVAMLSSTQSLAQLRGKPQSQPSTGTGVVTPPAEDTSSSTNTEVGEATSPPTKRPTHNSGAKKKPTSSANNVRKGTTKPPSTSL